MNREINYKILIAWLEDIWEEMEIQFYGIGGAIVFFLLVYLFFHPSWMSPLIKFFYNIKLFILSKLIQ